MTIKREQRAKIRSRRGQLVLLSCALAGLASTSCLPVPPELAAGEIRAEIRRIDDAVTRYVRSNGVFPQDIETLAKPDGRGRVFLDEGALTDPWGNAYGYVPGKYIPGEGEQAHNVICFGSDGAPGGDVDTELAQVKRGRV